VLPIIPDESKWDIVYVLPFFAKPGRHTYMIKYKNTKDPRQAKLIAKQNKLKNYVATSEIDFENT